MEKRLFLKKKIKQQKLKTQNKKTEKLKKNYKLQKKAKYKSLFWNNTKKISIEENALFEIYKKIKMYTYNTR